MPLRASCCKMVQIRSVEARGIEPRSRSTSVTASTCVAHLLPAHARGLRRVCYTGFQWAGLRDNYRPDSLSTNGRRGGPGCPGPRVRASLTCVRTDHFQAKGPERLGALRPRGRTAVQQLSFDWLFTWPADQPRHATGTSDTRSIPDRPPRANESKASHLFRWARALYGSATEKNSRARAADFAARSTPIKGTIQTKTVHGHKGAQRKTKTRVWFELNSSAFFCVSCASLWLSPSSSSFGSCLPRR